MSDAPQHLLIVEDDEAFARTLRRSFERREYTVHCAASVDEALAVVRAHPVGKAVVDLKLAGGASGLECVKALHEEDPDLLMVVLTGYASIATAVEAIKLGACHYLAKPSNTDVQIRLISPPPIWRGCRRRFAATNHAMPLMEATTDSISTA